MIRDWGLEIKKSSSFRLPNSAFRLRLVFVELLFALFAVGGFVHECGEAGVVGQGDLHTNQPLS